MAFSYVWVGGNTIHDIPEVGEGAKATSLCGGDGAVEQGGPSAAVASGEETVAAGDQ